jgi:hypothetical protein
MALALRIGTGDLSPFQVPAAEGAGPWAASIRDQGDLPRSAFGEADRQETAEHLVKSGIASEHLHV